MKFPFIKLYNMVKERILIILIMVSIIFGITVRNSINSISKTDSLRQEIKVRDFQIEAMHNNYLFVKDKNDSLQSLCDSLEHLRVQARIFTQNMKLNPPDGIN